MSKLKDQIAKIIKGEVDDSPQTLEEFSHDASLFELVPELVVAPKDVNDIKELVKFVAEHKNEENNLSLTMRSAGTCMSGGSINESIVVDMNKHFNKILDIKKGVGHAQPGVFYRDFEAETLKQQGQLMPSFPASRDLCTIGGMVANNSGGERSLTYGKTEEFIHSLKVVLADGNEYEMKALTKKELDKKMAQKDFEGKVYKQVFDLVEKNYDAIKAAKPNVSKDSTGYHIWDVWDRETQIFDITRLIVGSQGTLGVITDIKFKLVDDQQHSGTLVIFLEKMDNLGNVINRVLSHNPSTFEGFDNYTLMLSFKLFPLFYKQIGWIETIKLAIQLIPNALMLLRGIPKMVLLVEFRGNSAEDVAFQVHDMRLALDEFGHDALFEEDETEAKSRKFWIMRRASFKLLREKIKDKHTAPFMDDLVVPPSELPVFLPKIRKVIKKYDLLATIAGHMGDGNFHIIPLMNIEKKEEKAKLEPAMIEINKIVLEHGGSLSGEHNDGMIRGPWLEAMYGKEVTDYFRNVKSIFDPNNMFNPHKKTDSDWDFSMAHTRERF